jgi:hypothetical protein
MLRAIREHSKSWIIKVVLSLIALSFVIFGIMDIVMKQIQDRPVATVGDKKISPETLHFSVQDEMKRLQTQFKDVISLEQLKELRIHQHVLERMAQGLALEQLVHHLGIDVPNEFVKAYVEGKFHQDGDFNYNVFKKTLEQHRIHETAFVEDIRNNLKTQTLLTTMAQAIEFPDFYKQYFYKMMTKNHQLTYCKIPLSNDLHKVLAVKKNKKDPSEDDLKTFFNKHTDDYQLPEQRLISMIIIDHKKHKNVLDLVEKIEDALGGGDTLESISKKFNVIFKNALFADEKSLIFLGKDFANHIIIEASKMHKGEESPMIEKKGQTVLFKMDDIKAPQKISYNDVKKHTSILTKLKTDYDMNIRRDLAISIGTEFHKNVKNADGFQKKCDAHQLKAQNLSINRLVLQKSSPITDLDVSVFETVFTKKKGEIFFQFSKDHYYIFFINTTEDESSVDPSAQDTLFKNLTYMLKNDVSDSIVACAKHKFPLKINEKVFKIFDQNDA